jgi:transcriptional regulator with XRE-family HTH domain
MNFANNLKQLRIRRNLTQKEFAKLMNIAPSTVTMYEIGQREPNFTLLDKMATYFEVSADYLLGRKDIKINGESDSLITQIYKLSPEKRKALEILLEIKR